ncbi:cell division protein FtsK [Herbiconiux moechotypicola]|uniref:Integral membrane protein n=1 Tax=Herbiconiux moechotypicola TaxID=637393 RepID=A0ABP5Q2Y3_9MICO|nr:cell division protein FtsK [Herbiconiux moechotypicola]MCS5728151.1 cell division protein FtsK [Herbiconiux moechotypicola]
MSQHSTALEPSTTISLPGRAIISRIRRLVIVTVLVGALYGMLAVASAGRCVGGAAEQPADENSGCIDLVLKPSPLVFVALAAIVVLALTRVLKSAQTEAQAIRTLDRASTAVIVVAVGSFAIALGWFALIPIGDWTPGAPYAFLYPFPFGVVELSFR